jgi:hypothetical protein
MESAQRENASNPERVTQAESPPVVALATLEPGNTPSLSISATHEVNSTPTPDQRLHPERWQEWPIIPQISPRANEIYQKGIALGNEPRHFSKIGDCQSIPASFLGIYDTNRYSFSTQDAHLQETVNWYAGSFGREGESVRGGFNTAAVLLPFWANSAVCKPGENPIQCENRIHNPSVVFISLEVWFDGRTPDTYEKYLRRIIEYNIEQGTLPILATKADNVEGNHSINYTIAKLAYEYDLPMWNFWRAVQPLTDRGLDTTDPTGFHLNVSGWNMRSYSALQVLDAIRTTMNEQPRTVIETTPTPTALPTLFFLPESIDTLPSVQIQPRLATPSAPAPSIVFGLNSASETLGIFQGNVDAKNWQMLAGEGMRLLDASRFGLLAAQGTNLYALTQNKSRLISTILHPDSPQPAVWLTDGRIGAILQNGELVVIDGENIINVPIDFPPALLYTTPNASYLLWGAGECSASACAANQILQTNLESKITQTLNHGGTPAVSIHETLAFIENTSGANILTFLQPNGKTRTLPIPGNTIVQIAWSPDGQSLAVASSEVSAYSGRILRSWLYFVSPQGIMDGVLNLYDEAIEQISWSPDGANMLIVRRPTQGDYRLNFFIINTTYQTERSSLGFDLTSETFAAPSQVFWWP